MSNADLIARAEKILTHNTYFGDKHAVASIATELLTALRASEETVAKRTGLIKDIYDDLKMRAQFTDEPYVLNISSSIFNRMTELLPDDKTNAMPDMGWQPIETAPKDGNMFYIGTSVRYKAYKPQARKQGYPEGRFQVFDGYGWKNLDYTPTHWMPSPPPQDEGGL